MRIHKFYFLFLMLIGLFLSFSLELVAKESAVFKYGGAYRLRVDRLWGLPQFSQNRDDFLFDQQVRFNTKFISGENISLYLSGLHNFNLGEFDNAQSNSGSLDEGLVIDEANISWSIASYLDLKLGRIALDLDKGKLFSKNSFQLLPEIYEGAQLTFNSEISNVSMAIVKNYELTKKSDSSLVFLLNIDFPNWSYFADKASFQFVQYKDSNFQDPLLLSLGVTKRNIQSLSAHFEAFLAHFTINFDTAVQIGNYSYGATEKKIMAYMLDLNVDYHLDEITEWNIWLDLHLDSGGEDGDKINYYEPLFYDRHNNAGFFDMLKWGNLFYTSLGTSRVFINSLEVGFQTLSFFSKSKGFISSGIVDAAFTVDGFEYLGQEIDVWLDKKVINRVHFGVFGGVYFSSGALKAQTTSDGMDFRFITSLKVEL